MPKKVSVSTGFELCFPDTTWVLISTELLMPNHRHFGSSPVKKQTNKQTNKIKQNKQKKRKASTWFELIPSLPSEFQSHILESPHWRGGKSSKHTNIVKKSSDEVLWWAS